MRDLDPIREDASEADLTGAVVQADYAGGFPDRPHHGGVRAPAGPVGLAAQIPVDGIRIDAVAIVVELQTARELATQSPTSIRRRPGGVPDSPSAPPAPER